MGEIYGCPILLVQFFSREKIGTPSSQPSCLWEKFMTAQFSSSAILAGREKKDRTPAIRP